MIAYAFACAFVAMFAGWAADDGALLICGFFVFLVAFASLMHRDYDRNSHASETLNHQGQTRIDDKFSERYADSDLSHWMIAPSGDGKSSLLAERALHGAGDET